MVAWPEPATQHSSMSPERLSRFSIGTGATYLPLLVLKSSLTRPVIMSRPSSSITPRSPVLRKPSAVNDSRVSSGSLW